MPDKSFRRMVSTPPLTMEWWRAPHPSIPRNPLVADPLFLARYIEQTGTGTLDMIALFQEAILPEPEFRQDGRMFVQTLWRNWLTKKIMEALALDERQRDVSRLVRRSGRISNTEHREVK